MTLTMCKVQNNYIRKMAELFSLWVETFRHVMLLATPQSVMSYEVEVAKQVLWHYSVGCSQKRNAIFFKAIKLKTQVSSVASVFCPMWFTVKSPFKGTSGMLFPVSKLVNIRFQCRCSPNKTCQIFLYIFMVCAFMYFDQYVKYFTSGGVQHSIPFLDVFAKHWKTFLYTVLLCPG